MSDFTLVVALGGSLYLCVRSFREERDRAEAAEHLGRKLAKKLAEQRCCRGITTAARPLGQ